MNPDASATEPVMIDSLYVKTALISENTVNTLTCARYCASANTNVYTASARWACVLVKVIIENKSILLNVKTSAAA